jgi:hypothetical protein
MSIVKSLRNSLTAKSSTDLTPSTYRGSEPWHFWSNDGKEYVFKYSGHNSSLTAYTKCPPLTSIINRKAQAYINGKTWIMNTKGKESQSPEAVKLRKLLAKPNPLQSWKQFEAQQQIYIQLFGFCMVLPIIPVGFEKFGPIEATSMWNIPPHMLEIEESNKLFYQTDQKGIIKEIKLTYKGEKTTIRVNDIYIFKDITPSFNTLIFPESRICSLEMPINNIIGALESENVLINYRGALGIFTQEPGSGQFGALPMTPEHKEQLQNDFMRYGLKNKQWKFIVTTAAVKWQQVGVATKDLMLGEMIKEASMMICDGYNYPPHLMGLIDPTFNNQLEAGKSLYQNAIIPEAESNYEQWNNMFRTYDLNINMIKEYSHLPILQKDATAQATARKTLGEALKNEFLMNMITYNRFLELLGEDTRPGMDKYYFELLNEGWKFGAVGPTPPDPNNPNNNQPPSNGNQG